MDPMRAPTPVNLAEGRREFITWKPAQAVIGLSVALLGALSVLSSLVLPTFSRQAPATCYQISECTGVQIYPGHVGPPISAPITGLQLLQMGDIRTQALYGITLVCLLLVLPAFVLLRMGKPWLTLRAINLAVGMLIVCLVWLWRDFPISYAPTAGNIDFMSGLLADQFAGGNLVNFGITAGVALVFLGSCAELAGLHILIRAKYPMIVRHR